MQPRCICRAAYHGVSCQTGPLPASGFRCFFFPLSPLVLAPAEWLMKASNRPGHGQPVYPLYPYTAQTTHLQAQWAWVASIASLSTL